MGVFIKGAALGAGGYVGYKLAQGAFNTAAALVVFGTLRAGVMTMAEDGGRPDDGYTFLQSIPVYTVRNVKDTWEIASHIYTKIQESNASETRLAQPGYVTPR